MPNSLLIIGMLCSLCDWTFATIYSLHLTPKGSSYTGETRTFCHKYRRIPPPHRCRYRPRWAYVFLCWRKKRTILPLSQSAILEKNLLRSLKLDTTSEHAKARKTRHMLESFHGRVPIPKAVETAWPYLQKRRLPPSLCSSYCDRVAGSQKAGQDQAYDENNDLAAIHALLGLARCDHTRQHATKY